MDITKSRLTVRELPPGVTANTLKVSFERYGTVKGAFVNQDQGYVIFANSASVDVALRFKHEVAGKEVVMDFKPMKTDAGPKVPKPKALSEIRQESGRIKRQRTKGSYHLYSKSVVPQFNSNAGGVVSKANRQIEIVDLEKDCAETNETLKDALRKIAKLEGQLCTERQLNSQQMAEEREKFEALEIEVVKLREALVDADEKNALLQNDLNVSAAERVFFELERNPLALDYQVSEESREILQGGTALLRGKLELMNGEFATAERLFDRMGNLFDHYFQNQVNDQKSDEAEEGENSPDD